MSKPYQTVHAIIAERDRLVLQLATARAEVERYQGLWFDKKLEKVAYAEEIRGLRGECEGLAAIIGELVEALENWCGEGTDDADLIARAKAVLS